MKLIVLVNCTLIAIFAAIAINYNAYAVGGVILFFGFAAVWIYTHQDDDRVREFIDRYF